MGEYANFWLDHLIFILLAVVLPVFSLRRGEVNISDGWDTRTKKIFYYSNGAILWIGGAIIVGLWLFYDRPLTILGFRMPDMNAYTLFFSGIFLALYIHMIYKDFYTKRGLQKVLDKWVNRKDIMPNNGNEFIHYSFLALSAGVAEEVIFRGFLINYILALGDSSQQLTIFLALVIPAIIFGLIHMYQGTQAVIKIVVGGLLFSAIYYYSQSLVIVMIFHFLVDVITGFFLMRALRQVPIDGEAGS